jgi:hypothetical protein
MWLTDAQSALSHSTRSRTDSTDTRRPQKSASRSRRSAGCSSCSASRSSSTARSSHSATCVSPSFPSRLALMRPPYRALAAALPVRHYAHHRPNKDVLLLRAQEQTSRVDLLYRRHSDRHCSQTSLHRHRPRGVRLPEPLWVCLCVTFTSPIACTDRGRVRAGISSQSSSPSSDKCRSSVTSSRYRTSPRYAPSFLCVCFHRSCFIQGCGPYCGVTSVDCIRNSSIPMIPAYLLHASCPRWFRILLHR